MCCQNCFASVKLSSGESTTWSSLQREVFKVALGLSSGQIMYSIRRMGGGGEDERERTNERQCSATFLVGRRRHGSPLTPNFWRHIWDNCIGFIDRCTCDCTQLDSLSGFSNE